MLTNSTSRAGIIDSSALYCQVLEAPEIDTSPDPRIPQINRDTTYPIPYGAHSALMALNLGELTTFEYSLYGELNYCSNHQSGKTHYVSYRKLAKSLGTSVRYVRSGIASLIEKGWISVIAVGLKGTRYQLVHHKCKRSEIPTDKNGYACKYSVAYGQGSPRVRMALGHISHKAKTLWDYLAFRSDWVTGITHALSIRLLAKLLRMGKDTITACLQELKDAGLLRRLSPKHLAGVYQLYPKSNAKPKPRYRPKSDDEGSRTGKREMRADGDWRLSYNELWRINVETGQIQTRKSRHFGLWRGLTLGDAIPKAIQTDFDELFKFSNQLRRNLTVPEGAQGVLESAQGVPENAHPTSDTCHEPSLSMG